MQQLIWYRVLDISRVKLTSQCRKAFRWHQGWLCVDDSTWVDQAQPHHSSIGSMTPLSSSPLLPHQIDRGQAARYHHHRHHHPQMPPWHIHVVHRTKHDRYDWLGWRRVERCYDGLVVLLDEKRHWCRCRRMASWRPWARRNEPSPMGLLWISRRTWRKDYWLICWYLCLAIPFNCHQPFNGYDGCVGKQCCCVWCCALTLPVAVRWCFDWWLVKVK